MLLDQIVRVPSPSTTPPLMRPPFRRQSVAASNVRGGGAAFSRVPVIFTVLLPVRLNRPRSDTVNVPARFTVESTASIEPVFVQSPRRVSVAWSYGQTLVDGVGAIQIQVTAVWRLRQRPQLPVRLSTSSTPPPVAPNVPPSLATLEP